MNKANNFLSSTDFDFSGKTVLVRIDCDVDLGEENGNLVVTEDFRLKQILPTLKFLKEKKVKKIIMIGHLGRPDGQKNEKYSLAPIADWFTENYKDCSLVPDYQLPVTNYLSLLDNLRFHSAETENDQKFAQQLASLADVYINEAFATSHRSHASIVGIPKYLDSFLGLNFEQEIKNLTKIKKNAQRPLVIILGGAKKGKLDYVPFLADLADTLLIGGKLPLILKRKHLQGGVAPAAHLGGENSDKSVDSKLILAGLKPNGCDISRKSIVKFKDAVNQAQSIFMAGPLGVFEEKKNQEGTCEITKAVAERSISSDGVSINSSEVMRSDKKVFTLAAGGDTHRVLSWLDLWDKFDFVSTGGGAALQFLRDETLPGIKVIL
jgi:phosphoglycerate kinase